MGVTGPNTFVNRFSEISNLPAINMGVPSYAPTAYKKVIEKGFDQGVHSKTVFVVVDKSDVTDEFYRYKNTDNNLLSLFLVGTIFTDNIYVVLPRTYGLYRALRDLTDLDSAGNFESGAFTHQSWTKMSWGSDARPALTLYKKISNCLF
jgi:hypothetical protein